MTGDHLAGDRDALGEHKSYYLELAPSLHGNKERPILTVKTRVTYRGRDYVVGWYVPVDLGESWPNEDELRLREEAGQVKFKLAKDKPGDGQRVKVGSAIKSGPKQDT